MAIVKVITDIQFAKLIEDFLVLALIFSSEENRIHTLSFLKYALPLVSVQLVKG